MNPVFYLGLGFIACGGLAFWEARRITAMFRRPGVFDYVGPDYYFLGIGVAMATVGAILAARWATVPSAGGGEPQSPSRRHLAIFAVTAMYVALIWGIGYALATLAFFIAAFRMMGVGNWRVTLASSLTAAAIFYLLFVRLADMPLPT